LVLGRCKERSAVVHSVDQRVGLTDNEGDHGCAISSCRLEALDEFLDLPDLDVLLCFVLRRGRHGE
jgi:hypothetical protein